MNPGTGLTGGGSVPLGGGATLGVANGGIGTVQLAGGSVTTSKFDTNAQAPDSAKLGGASPSDYGGVMMGRMNALTTDFGSADYGSPNETSTASFNPAGLIMLSPNRALKIRDFSVRLTAAPGTGAQRVFGVSINGGNGEICSIQNTATTCAGTGSVDVPANSTLAIVESPVFSTPANADALFAFRWTTS